MPLETIPRYLGVWSAIGCALFSAYVVLVFRTGLVYTARQQDGTLKEHIPLSGILNMLIFLLSIVGLQVVANYFGLARQARTPSFVALFMLNYGHYLILFIFDTVVIDGLVLGMWRPGFLQLPDNLGVASMKEHILASIPVGAAAGIGLAAMSTLISYLILFKS